MAQSFIEYAVKRPDGALCVLVTDNPGVSSFWTQDEAIAQAKFSKIRKTLEESGATNQKIEILSRVAKLVYDEPTSHSVVTIGEIFPEGAPESLESVL